MHALPRRAQATKTRNRSICPPTTASRWAAMQHQQPAVQTANKNATPVPNNGGPPTQAQMQNGHGPGPEFSQSFARQYANSPTIPSVLPGTTSPSAATSTFTRLRCSQPKRRAGPTSRAFRETPWLHQARTLATVAPDRDGAFTGSLNEVLEGGGSRPTPAHQAGIFPGPASISGTRATADAHRKRRSRRRLCFYQVRATTDGSPRRPDGRGRFGNAGGVIDDRFCIASCRASVVGSGRFPQRDPSVRRSRFPTHFADLFVCEVHRPPDERSLRFHVLTAALGSAELGVEVVLERRVRCRMARGDSEGTTKEQSELQAPAAGSSG